MSSESFRFAHRENANGTVDSICPCCFVTVASASSEAVLLGAEQQHICDPLLVEHYRAVKKKVEAENLPSQSDAAFGT
jgi:hypothetical protein